MTIVSVKYAGATLTAPGVIPRPHPGACDLLWPESRFGPAPGVLLLNGDLGQPVQLVQGLEPLEINTDDGMVSRFGSTMPLEFGQATAYYPLLHKPALAAPPGSLGGPYGEGGPPVDSAPLDLLAAVTSWGPAASKFQHSSGGSPQLVAAREPAAMAALYLHAHGRPTDLSDGYRRFREELLGGYKIYEIKLKLDAPGEWYLDWWRSKDNPEWTLFAGYNKQVGGFSNLYSSPKPPGVTWASSGLQCPEQDHASVGTMAVLAGLTGDVLPLLDARCGVESLISALRREESTGGRGFAGLLNALSETWATSLAFGLDCSWYPEYLDFVLTKLEGRNVG